MTSFKNGKVVKLISRSEKYVFQVFFVKLYYFSFLLNIRQIILVLDQNFFFEKNQKF